MQARPKTCQSDPWVRKIPQGMAIHSSILAWRIPRIEEPGRLQFIGSRSQTRLKRLSMARVFRATYDSAFPLEKEMATHFNNLAWEILWTEELEGLQSMWSKKSQM